MITTLTGRRNLQGLMEALEGLSRPLRVILRHQRILLKTLKGRLKSSHLKGLKQALRCLYKVLGSVISHGKGYEAFAFLRTIDEVIVGSYKCTNLEQS